MSLNVIKLHFLGIIFYASREGCFFLLLFFLVKTIMEIRKGSNRLHLV